MLKKLSKQLLQNIGLPTSATLPSNISRTITPIIVAREQSVENNQLNCKLAHYYLDSELKLDISAQQKQHFIYQFYASTLTNKTLTKVNKSALFKQQNMTDIANIFTLSEAIHSQENKGELTNVYIDTDWVDINADSNGRLAGLFNNMVNSWFTADKGDSKIVADYLAKANHAYLNGDADSFIKYATIVLSRDPNVVDLWKNLGAVFRSTHKYQLAKTCYYYAMAIEGINAYELMSLALTYFQLGDHDTALSLASFSYFLDNNTKWVKSNYEMIINEDK
ncbi:tetratricopeptide repeat protein [Shewanella sp. D64]|uniref:tetratricopeptide repeat protein n=1 Tax=unclassified Shewanella TaxID=196818 RepID=UPI0022BA5807|nr:MULTISPECIES: hypothetical protein [unclassified Shewanella]MEC4725024.1 tetratricopeptide repeat protein [Shewanella sp. D64]MEC4736925.1 tetratricopeptide repeat protein [Shewanella sp. E94]WBJ96520.1 tetratricopeptide repeat protein [Shewanella sp. MTB7]